MVEQRPAAVAVGAAGKEDFEAVVPRDAHAAGAAVAEQRVHFCTVLCVRRAAQAEAVGEEAGPVFAVPLALVEPAAEAVGSALLAVGEVKVPPVPGRQRLVLVTL